MHKYLRCIGFSRLKTKSHEEIAINDVIKSPHKRSFTTNPNDTDTLYAEYSKEFAPGMGIKVCGQKDENDNFFMETYFPYYEGRYDSSDSEVVIDKKMNSYEFSGLCNDDRMGISLVFHLNNPVDYLSNRERKIEKKYRLSGLASNGIVILPTKNTENVVKNREVIKENVKYNNNVVNMDEYLPMGPNSNEFFRFSKIDYRMSMHEDVLSIAETAIVPWGLEAELYKILGIILDVNKYTNIVLDEKVYTMKILCNDMIFDICINESDLYGEPVEGRRFRGIIWLQGKEMT